MLTYVCLLLCATFSLISSTPLTAQCSNIRVEDRIDCNPDDPSPSKCTSRSCCWQAPGNPALNNSLKPGSVGFSPPYCYFPSNYVGYKVVNVTEFDRTTRIVLKRQLPSGFTDDVQNVNVDVHQLDDYKVRIKIYDADSQRYEVPLPKLNVGYSKIYNKLYEVSHTESGQLSVTRKSTGTVIFKTQLQLLTFADQYLQLTTTLPSKYVYGLGEHKDYFRKEATWRKYTMFNFDDSPDDDNSSDYHLYGSHPFYLTVEDEHANSDGVFLFNSNPMDILLQPAPALTWRSIGGIFDIFIFLGPSASEVVRQFNYLVGLPMLPPFWGLGFQLCRWGYGTANNTEMVFQRNVDAGIPIEVQWNDIDAMKDYNDFTYNPVNFAGLQNFVERLHQQGRKYIFMFDAAVGAGEAPGSYPPFDDGLKQGVFIKNSSGQVLYGKVWNVGASVWPDFTNPQSLKYWAEQFQRFHKQLSFDGVWNDMNEPSSFADGSLNGCPQSRFEDPQYLPGVNNKLRQHTICMTAQHWAGRHYDVHNIHGLSVARASNYALKSLNKRPFIISRSSFSGLGHFAGHWDGDIYSEWETMRWTITSVLNFNMFGVPLMGADICGFGGNTTVELCARWSALGAFYPFSRNHNDLSSIEQDPVALGPLVVAAAKNSLAVRYSLLSYLYTLFYKAHVFGDTVFRPLFFEFPSDQTSYSIDKQFLWGDALLFVPTLHQAATTVTGYVPAGVWYDFFNSTPITSQGQYQTFPSPLTSPPVILVRGGRVITTQLAKMTTTETRKGNFSLIVALDENLKAKGDLFWDDGESVQLRGRFNYFTFLVQNGFLTIDRVHEDYHTTISLERITVLGQRDKPTEVLVNQTPVDFVYTASLQKLDISVTSVSLLNDLTVQWK